MKLINIFKQTLKESSLRRSDTIEKLRSMAKEKLKAPRKNDRESDPIEKLKAYEKSQRPKNTTSTDYRDFITNSGDLLLSRTKVSSLPDGLEVDGDLRLGYELNTLPNNLKIKGDLEVGQSRISNFPKGLEIGGDLDLRSRDNITDIPKDIVVKGTLFLPQNGFSLAKKYPVETLKKIFPNVKNIEIIAPKKF